MAITTLDGLIAALGASTRFAIVKPSISNQLAGTYCALWRSAGYPAQGAIPGSAAYCDDTLLGGFPLPSVSTEKLYLGRLAAQCANAGVVQIWDRLAQMGGLSGTVATAQTVNVDVATPASNGRCQSDGSDVRWFAEWYTDTGATTANLTTSYTDQSDNTGNTSQTIALPATVRASRCYEILPATTDQSIKSIQTLTLSQSTGTAGSFGVTARKLVAEIPLTLANIGNLADYAALALPEIKPDSCLEILIFCSTTSSGLLTASLDVLKG